MCVVDQICSDDQHERSFDVIGFDTAHVMWGGGVQRLHEQVQRISELKGRKEFLDGNRFFMKVLVTSHLTCSPTDFLCSLNDWVVRPILARPDGAVVFGAGGVSSSWKSSTSRGNCGKIVA